MHRRLITIALTAVTFAFCASGAEAAPVAECDLVAAPGGNDSAAGTAEAPLASAQGVVDRLAQGQTGCFAEGTYEVGNYKIEKAGITLTSLEGAAATVRGRIWIAGDNVIVEELILNNKTESELPSTVTGDNVVLRSNEITNDNSTICFTIGSASGWGRAYDTLIEDNSIHHCGRLPASNYDHGLYVEASTDAVIRNNWIYQNADRGIQLYPDAQGTLIEGNVIDRNGQGIIFGGSPETASSDTIVRNNLITNSRLRDNVESYYDQGDPVGSNNVVTDNCISGGAYDDGDGGILKEAKGFDAQDNLLVIPDYSDPEAGDFSVPSGSPCADVLSGVEVEEPTEEEPVEDDPILDEEDPEEVAPSLTLTAAKSVVKRGRTLRLRGEATGVTSVDIVTKRDAQWVTVSTVDAQDGHFAAAIDATDSGRKTFKAMASGVETTPVQVKIRRR